MLPVSTMKKYVLNDPRVKKLFKDTNTHFLIADWTNKNSNIAKELRVMDGQEYPYI